KGYEPWMVVTTSGRMLHGIIKESTADAITLQVAGNKVTVPLSEIEEKQPSKVSVMPNELLKPLDEHEVRSLVAYLSRTAQTPILALPESAVYFSAFGPDLNYWQRVHGAWKVDGGEMVAPGGQTGAPSILLSDLVLDGDFELRVRLHAGKAGNGAVVLTGD